MSAAPGGTAPGGQPLRLHSVGFAPVKGTRHLARPDAVFDSEGPIGDRRFCLVDVTKRQVLRTVQTPSLIGIVAGLQGDELELVLPDGRSARAVPEVDGEVLTCDYWMRAVDLELVRGPFDELLSSWLSRPVRLARASRGDVVFGSPLSIVTTASISEVAGRLDFPGLVDEAARFRATAVIGTDEPFIEETWQGRVMDFGGVQVRIGAPIPRCAVIDLDPVTGRRNMRLLKGLSSCRPKNDAGEPVFGVNVEIL